MSPSRALFLLLLLAGCRPPPIHVGNYTLDKPNWDEARKAIVSRATFELKCPEAELKLTVLGTWPGVEDVANQVGVEGCDHRLVYVNEGWGRWVLNSEQKGTQ